MEDFYKGLHLCSIKWRFAIGRLLILRYRGSDEGDKSWLNPQTGKVFGNYRRKIRREIISWLVSRACKKWVLGLTLFGLGSEGHVNETVGRVIEAGSRLPPHWRLPH